MTPEEKWKARVSKLKVSFDWGPSLWVDISTEPGKGKISQCLLTAPAGKCPADGSIYLVRDLGSGKSRRETVSWLREKAAKKKSVLIFHPDTNEREKWTIAKVFVTRQLSKDGQALHGNQ